MELSGRGEGERERERERARESPGDDFSCISAKEGAGRKDENKSGMSATHTLDIQFD